MRLLFITPTLPDRPDKDGMTQVGYFLLRELVKQHEIRVWSVGPDQGQISGAKETKIFLGQPTSLPKHYLTGQRLPLYQAHYESDQLHSALRQLPTNEVDLVILHSPFVAHYIHDLPDHRVVIQAMDAMSTWFTKTAAATRSPLRLWHLLQEARRATQSETDDYRLAKLVTTVSEADAATLQSRLPGIPVTTFPIGIDQATFYPPTAPRDPATVVLSGVMDYPPNVDAAVWFTTSVWPTIHQRHPQAELRLVGKNPATAVRALAGQRGVTVTGRVPSVADELRRATVAVSPLRFGTGFKIKVAEALACGTPLVVSPASVPGISIQAGRECLVAESADEFITAVDQLLTDPAQRAKLSIAALAFAQRLQWPLIAARYVDAYEQAHHV